jgi:hypothetical protein
MLHAGVISEKLRYYCTYLNVTEGQSQPACPKEGKKYEEGDE